MSQRPPAKRVAWISGQRPERQKHVSALNVAVVIPPWRDLKTTTHVENRTNDGQTQPPTGDNKMNQSHDSILAAYKNADFNHRLHIYLQYPRLRSEFFEIDREDLKADASNRAKCSLHSLTTQLNELIGSAASSVKRLVGVGSA